MKGEFMRVISIFTVALLSIVLLSAGIAESAPTVTKKLSPAVSLRPAKTVSTTVKAIPGRNASVLSSACKAEWQGPAAFVIPGWFAGNEFYASYQDPSETGCTNTFPYEIQMVTWEIQNDSNAVINVNMQAIIYDVDSTTANCVKPGAELFVGSLFTVPVPPGGVIIEIPLDSGFCVSGPYFAAIFAPDTVGTSMIAVTIDDTVTVAPRACANYNHYRDPEGFEDLVAFYGFPGNIRLFSTGLSANSNACQSCCVGFIGNVNNDPNDKVDITDLTMLIDHLFISLTPLVCSAEANIDGDPVGNIDITDLTSLIDHLFISLVPLPPCK